MNALPSSNPSTLSSDERRSPFAVIIALAFGLMLYLALPPGPAGDHSRTATWRVAAATTIALLTLFPHVNAVFERTLDQLRHPTDRARWKIAVVIAVAASAYFVLTALNQGRDFFAKTHDECAYLIQTQMLARGRLWMPAHPLADFFDTFYVLTTPKYISITFPGSAIFFVLALWLHVPPWIIPVLIAGSIVGLIYRILTELTDGVGGLLAAALVVSLSWFRMLSIMLMSQLPVLLLGLIMMWAYLRWRRVVVESRGTPSSGSGWLLLVGACSGWAAITRPVDALIVTMPVGVALLMGLLRTKGPIGLRSGALVVLAAIPFLAIQAAINRGVTGHFTETPAKINLDRDTPGGAYGFHAQHAHARAHSAIFQKQLDYDLWAAPFVARHRPNLILQTWWTRRFPIVADVTLPARTLLVLLPVGLLALRGSRWLVFSTLPLFFLGYVGWAFFVEHYAVVIIPAVVLLLVLAIRKIHELRVPLASAAIAFTFVLAVTGCWELNRAVSDEPFHATWLRELHNTTETNAIVLFTFDLDPTSPDIVQRISQEPVYNTDVAWPDDAALIRAHDLGPRNVELFRYYAERSPDRRVYRLSRRTGAIEDLGIVRDLAPR